MSKRVAVFIDGITTHAMMRSLDKDMDYKKLIHFIETKIGDVLRPYYYSTVVDNPPDQSANPIRALMNWLDFQGFTISSRNEPVYTDPKGIRRVSGTMDTQIVADMVSLAASGRITDVVLCSSSSALSPAIYVCKSLGVHVTLIGNKKENTFVVFEELRRACDTFIDMNDILPHIEREQLDSIPSRRQRSHPVASMTSSSQPLSPVAYGKPNAEEDDNPIASLMMPLEENSAIADLPFMQMKR